MWKNGGRLTYNRDGLCVRQYDLSRLFDIMSILRQTFNSCKAPAAK